MPHFYTEEQLLFMKENITKMSWKELTVKFNKKFNTDLSYKAISGKGKRSGIKSGRTGQFVKGNSPVNKGKKFPGKINRTSFKKGNKPANYKPVGSERVTKDGYIEVKIADPKTWRSKHIVIWERVHGPIPKNHCLLFLDGNKQNINLSNLQLISRKQLARLNKNKLIFNDAEMTKAGLIIADIYNKIGERKKKIRKVKN